VRVIVTLTDDGIKETKLEGDTDVFDDEPGYGGSHKRLTALGFWLDNWRYAKVAGNNHKSRCFIPWSSCLFVETKEGGS